jgi:hypothetical protein
VFNPLTDSKQVTSVQANRMAKLAGWASVVNIISWLLTAIPGFLNSPLSWPAVVTIPLSTLVALVAGIRGLVNKGKLDERGAGQCVIGIFVGVVNALVIGLVLVAIYGMANSNFW